MSYVNMLEAKTHLSKLVDNIERGIDDEIVIARNGRPVARLVAIRHASVGQRIGLLKGVVVAPSLEMLDSGNAEIDAMFEGRS